MRLPFPVLLRATMTGLLLMAFGGCSADGLTPLPDDSGQPRDAGSQPTDGGHRDAGLGVDGGGALDGGSSLDLDCQWGAPIPPFECEDDADFCDYEGDAEPARDILAGWSRVEGDRLFIQLRFASWPFPIQGEDVNDVEEWYRVATHHLALLFGPGDPLFPSSPTFAMEAITDPAVGEHVYGEKEVYLYEAGSPRLQGDDGCYSYQFPPEIVASGYYTYPGNILHYYALDARSSIRMSTQTPLLEIELGLANALPATGILSWAVSNVSNETSLVRPDGAGFSISKGGASDDSNSLVPAREWTCPGIRPNSLVAEAICAAGASGVCAPDGSAWTCVEGEPRFEAWCQNVNRAACAVFDGHGARCVIGPFDENCLGFDEIRPMCNWAKFSELCGEGDEIDFWGCEFTEWGGGGCTLGIDACSDEDAASVPFCRGDLRVESCHAIGNQPTFSDCSTWFPGGKCEDGACTGIGNGWPCDGAGFLCDQGLVCDIGPSATMGECVFPDADAGP